MSGRSGDRVTNLLYVEDVAHDPYIRLDTQPEVALPALREEARRLAADTGDRVELKTLREELDELVAAWPAD